MAPWSLWSQSTTQQEPLPSPPILKTSSPLPGPTPATPSTKVSNLDTRDARYEEMPSSTELWQIATKSVQTGAVTGGIGLFIGAGSGIMRSAPPTLFAVFAGLQWFALGSTYMASKDLLCHAWGGEENLNSSDLVKASGVAGGISGMVGGMIRGPRNILPGMLFFSAAAAGSSYVSQLSQSAESKPKTSWLDSKWSPLQRLSDKDYMDKIEEKILRLNAEIAIIDENIAALKESSQPPVKSIAPTTK